MFIIRCYARFPSRFQASAAPPITFPNVYGIDMPANKEFVAHDRTMTQIAYHLEVDGLYYQSLDDLIACCRHPDPGKQDPAVAAQFASEYDCSCFDGILFFLFFLDLGLIV